MSEYDMPDPGRSTGRLAVSAGARTASARDCEREDDDRAPHGHTFQRSGSRVTL